MKVRDIKPIGFYELVHAKNPFGSASGYHAISIIFMAVTDNFQKIKLDVQSAEFKFAKELPNEFNIQTFNGVI